MKNKLLSLKTLVVFLFVSFFALIFSFHILNQNYQSQVNVSLDELYKGSNTVSTLGTAIQRCQALLNTYSQTFNTEDYLEYENQTQLIFHYLDILTKDTSYDKDCLLFSRVIYQINESQQSFSQIHVFNQDVSTRLFENVRTINYIFSEMNKAYSQYQNAYLRLNNTRWLSIQKEVEKFKNFQIISWWFISFAYFSAFIYILKNMLEKNKAKIELTEQKQLSNEARLRMLQMQINPHFLFNTLNLIIHSIEEGASNTAIRLIKATSELLRQSIEINEKRIPISKELSLLRTYLFIFQERFQGRISLELDIENASLSTMIPPFIIQPLIENSIKHGFSELTPDASISIELKDFESYTLLSVQDNGSGAPVDLLDQILSGKIHSTGISNIYERLYLLYKHSDVMSIETASGIGTTVNIKLYKGL